MKIKMLGTGGAINEGLPYNAFIVDDNLLVESPPDVMNSLYREGIERKDISAIYISHFHADHCFGLPFLLLRNFFDGYTREIDIFGPKGIRQRVSELCTLAFGPESRMLSWVNTYVRCHEVEEGKEAEVCGKYILTPIRMFHSEETYGFNLEVGGKRLLYIADSFWDVSLLSYMDDASVILIDLNGEKSDTVKVHISEDDLVDYALPSYKNREIIFYGTHLKSGKISSNSKIRYLKPGDEIMI
jgi:phosphoribosyl 1,2-cyclic phosphodiesterase